MNQYERLLQLASDDGVEVIDYKFESERVKGLYCDNTIAIADHLASSTEKACVLAEELGHHYTSSGIILDQSNASNRKQEKKARLWAYKKMVTIDKLISSFESGCRNRYEVAEHIEVTEQFLQDALDRYKEIYGNVKQHNDYLIIFEPLRICRLT